MSGRQIMAYLLGELAEKERARLEEAFFADDALFEEMRIVETELIDAYVRNRLSADERRRFEARYLSTPALRQRVELARALAETAGRAGAGLESEPKHWWAWAPSAGWWPKPAMVTAFAAAALFLVAVGAWWATKPSSLPETTQARREAPANPATGPAAAPASPTPSATTPPGDASSGQSRPDPASRGGFALVLASSLVRSGGTEPVLNIPAGVDSVRIRIDYGGELFATYRVALSTPEGRDVWSQSGLTPLQPGAASVAATVPTRDLLRGHYILTLSAGATGGPLETIAEYGLRVERQ